MTRDEEIWDKKVMRRREELKGASITGQMAWDAWMKAMDQQDRWLKVLATGEAFTPAGKPGPALRKAQADLDAANLDHFTYATLLDSQQLAIFNDLIGRWLARTNRRKSTPEPSS